MARVFISYRRSDSAAHAGRLYDRLSAHFGKGSVFMDIDEIAPGEDFIEVIHRSFDDCETVIVLIGPRWLAMADGGGKSRLDDPEDPVRMEVTNALERKLRVVPVLVAGATMPGLSQLPSPLAPLSRRNAVDISDTRFHRDVDVLIEALERPIAPATPRAVLSPAAAPSPAPTPVPAPAPPPIPEPAIVSTPTPTRKMEPAASEKEVEAPRPEKSLRADAKVPTPKSPLAKALVAGGVTLALIWVLVVLVPAMTRQTSPPPPAAVEAAKAEPAPASVASTEPTPAVTVDDPQKRAAEAYRKGKDYFFGDGVKKDEAQAAEQFKIAADLGHVSAQGALGYLYFEGIGVKQNLVEGIRLMTIAADAGIDDAQNNLAAAYVEGKGVKRDYGEALRLYRKSAEQKNAHAQSNLGLMYENGWGVKRDLNEAKRWYQLAAAQGDTEGVEALKRLDGGKKAAN